MSKIQHGRDLNPAEMCQMLDEWANGASESEMAEFAKRLAFNTHRTLQQRIMALIVKCIEQWASLTDGQTDPRNAATVSLCKKIVKATGDKYDRYLPTI